MSFRSLLDKAARNDNSIRCIVVSIRRKALPRIKTSCVAKTNRRCCCFPSVLSSAKANWSNGSSRLCSADSSTLTARAFGSLAQHSGDFVLMLLFGLQVTTTRQFQTTKSVGGALSKSKEMAVQTIPKEDATARDKAGR